MKTITIVALLFLFGKFIQVQSEPFWSFKTNGSLYASLTIENESGYMASSASLFCSLNKESDRETWNNKTDEANESDQGIEGSMELFSEAEGVLYALNRSEGTYVFEMTFKWRIHL